jgi:TetR/AcrR family transcriptional repressor of nem operon
MVRYSAEHKIATRERIVKAAAKRFRERGIGRIGIAELMGELDLTHGGFYRHFDSKDALFEAALDEAFTQVGDRLARAAEENPQAPLAAIIASYLSDQHCSHPGAGCPMAALAAEVARLGRSVAKTMQRVTARHAERFAQHVPGRTAEERRRNALVLFSGMSGTLAAARALPDPAARRSLLESARRFYTESFQ